MNLNLSRDSASLWVGAGAALVAYLTAAGYPPNEWVYQDWLQFCAAVFAFLMGKLQTSPLKGDEQLAKEDKERERGRK
jgi:hypothetical protein